MSTDTYDCIIYAAGEYYGGEPTGDELPENCLVVAADGGLDHVLPLGIVPDIVIGDHDSAKSPVSSISAATVITLPPEHDDPDMLSALKAGWERGARRFNIYGGLGGRTDHTIANIQLMGLLAQAGGIGFLFGRYDVVTAISDGQLDFAAAPHSHSEMVSVFSLSDEAQGVCEAGLKYELTGATMHNTEVQGVSNEFLHERKATIGVNSGTLIVTFAAGTPLPQLTTPRKTSASLGPLSNTISSHLAVN